MNSLNIIVSKSRYSFGSIVSACRLFFLLLVLGGQSSFACTSQKEGFDTYVNGSSLHGLGDWIGWDENPAATAFVTNTQSLSPSQSVEINGASDLVHPFCASGGAWSYSAWQYIPSDFVSGGEVY